MRIIAGKYRGRRLQSPPSLATRPTSDRLREALFNVLAPRIEGARFLDLCAGSGAVGIEALSRGADHVTLVDQSRKMCQLIGANLEKFGVPADDADVRCSDAGEFLRRHSRSDSPPFNIVFFDPPYTNDYEDVLAYLGGHGETLLASEGLVIVEHHRKKELCEEFGTLLRSRVLRQGDSSLSFFKPST